MKDIYEFDPVENNYVTDWLENITFHDEDFLYDNYEDKNDEVK